jgi:hypothetical protein
MTLELVEIVYQVEVEVYTVEQDIDFVSFISFHVDNKKGLSVLLLLFAPLSCQG